MYSFSTTKYLLHFLFFPHYLLNSVADLTESMMQRLHNDNNNDEDEYLTPLSPEYTPSEHVRLFCKCMCVHACVCQQGNPTRGVKREGAT